MITSTLKLVFCWVCHSETSLHEHHVVPSSLGGSNGPTVTLCATCHNLVHSPKIYVGAAKIGYLRSVIEQASNAVRNDPSLANKRWKYSRTWSNEQHLKLVALSKIYGNQELVVDKALDLLYTKHYNK